MRHGPHAHRQAWRCRMKGRPPPRNGNNINNNMLITEVFNFNKEKYSIIIYSITLDLKMNYFLMPAATNRKRPSIRHGQACHRQAWRCGMKGRRPPRNSNNIKNNMLITEVFIYNKKNYSITISSITVDLKI